jgi:hypothetical protein
MLLKPMMLIHLAMLLMLKRKDAAAPSLKDVATASKNVHHAAAH